MRGPSTPGPIGANMPAGIGTPQSAYRYANAAAEGARRVTKPGHRTEHATADTPARAERPRHHTAAASAQPKVTKPKPTPARLRRPGPPRGRAISHAGPSGERVHVPGLLPQESAHESLRSDGRPDQRARVHQVNRNPYRGTRRCLRRACLNAVSRRDRRRGAVSSGRRLHYIHDRRWHRDSVQGAGRSWARMGRPGRGESGCQGDLTGEQNAR